MTTTIKLGADGRVVLPKAIRETLNLTPGTKVRMEVVGDKVVLTREVPEAKIVRGKDGLPVVVGWDGFNAAKAVREAREEHLRRLEKPFKK